MLGVAEAEASFFAGRLHELVFFDILGTINVPDHFSDTEPHNLCKWHRVQDESWTAL